MFTRANNLTNLLKKRILILDGAMGTMIQKKKLTEKQYRGIPVLKDFQNHPIDLKGNNELLNITQADIITDIHKQYLEAGADIIETNTFGATQISQADYKLSHLAKTMNIAAARLAKKICQEYSKPDQPRFVAGAIGPTSKTASISPDVNNPGSRNVSFIELKNAYYEQIEGLFEGGCDLFLVETIFDTLNAKAALFSIDEFFEKNNVSLPIMISGTVTDASGRILSGQTVEAFWNSMRHAKPLVFGLNCALGATAMRPYIVELSKICDTFISCYPNAGLPNPMSDTGFEETPDITANLLNEFAKNGFVNIVGGCCGTTPQHIRAISQLMKQYSPRILGKTNE